jgi:hypothetical protein
MKEEEALIQSCVYLRVTESYIGANSKSGLGRLVASGFPLDFLIERSLDRDRPRASSTVVG